MFRVPAYPDAQNGLALEIEDEGCPFDPRLAEQPQQAASLEDAKTSG